MKRMMQFSVEKSVGLARRGSMRLSADEAVDGGDSAPARELQTPFLILASTRSVIPFVTADQVHSRARVQLAYIFFAFLFWFLWRSSGVFVHLAIRFLTLTLAP